MSQNQKDHGQIKLEAKRQTELWIYSFADMYMILSVFFIAIAVIYAARVKNNASSSVASAGRGPVAVKSMISVDFASGSDEISSKAENELELLLPVMRASMGAIEIEGYTDASDSVSISDTEGGFTSNLDLGSSRAVRVAEWLTSNGVSAKRIRAASFGDSFDHKSGEGNRVANRRVVLKVLPVEEDKIEAKPERDAGLAEKGDFATADENEENQTEKEELAVVTEAEDRKPAQESDKKSSQVPGLKADKQIDDKSKTETSEKKAAKAGEKSDDGKKEELNE